MSASSSCRIYRWIRSSRDFLVRINLHRWIKSKKNGKKDLGLIYSETPLTVAAMFTRNLVKAAPVVLGQQRSANGLCQAVIVNSGNANCCTGEQGMQDAMQMGRLIAQGLKVDENDVLVSSTGVIGEPLPIEKIAYL